MTNTAESVHRELEALKAKFIQRLPEMSDAISRHWTAFSAGQPGGQDDLIDQAHKLAGVAGIFGLREVSRQASAIEDALLRCPDNHGAEDLLIVEQAVARIKTLTDELSYQERAQ